MIINGFWLAIVTTTILTEIYLLSKYITDKNGIFVENKFGSFVNGAILYFFITFITFLPFVWIKLNILYLVVIFWIKEGVTILFLLTRAQKYFEKVVIKEYIFLICGAVIVTVVWNYGVSYLVKPVEETPKGDFTSILTFNDVLAKITKIDVSEIKNWTTTILVSIIGCGSVKALISEYSYSVNWISRLGGLLLTIMATILFSYKLPLWQNAETFMAIFLILVCSRIIVFSRRRYGITFAVAAGVSFMFGEHLRLGLWGIAIVTMVVYTYMKKPQNSLFWVMLIAPLLIIEAFNTYTISRVLSIVLICSSVFLFIFMLSLQGVKPLKKINSFFEKYRVATPVIIGIAFLVASISIIFTRHIDWLSLDTINNSIIYPLDDNYIYKWVNLILFGIITFTLTVYIFIKIVRKIKFERLDFIFMISLLTIFSIYNPLADAMFSTSVFKDDLKHLSSLIFLPMYILVVNESIKLQKNNW